MATVTANPVPYLSQAEIEQRADETLRLHGLGSIPINPVTLANRLGIAVHNAKFADDKLVGMIAKRGDRVTLLVNVDDPPLRKRFTIAHELGHHFMHLLADGEFVDGEANLFRSSPDPTATSIIPDRRQEIQANQFAAALLMPASAVRAEWPALGSIQGMARRFNVSEEAMGYRVVQLGLA